MPAGITPDQPDKRTVYVTTAAEAAAIDARTLSGGIRALELMMRAGEAAARAITRELPDRVQGDVCVFTGAGNNGGDGWIVAGALARGGARVRVVEAAPPRSEEARAAREGALSSVTPAEKWSRESVVVDALLGTGSSGAPRGAIAAAIAGVGAARASGASVVALDVPSGLDATTGDASEGVLADLTITFGSAKRGQLRARDRCGRIVVMDIGLAAPGDAESLPRLVTPADAYGWVPAIRPRAHKGSRGGVSIIGGGAGMAGAAILAGRAALRSGAGSARICVADANVAAVHVAVPAALVTAWSKVLSNSQKYLGDWPEAIAIGPGLDTTGDAPELLSRALATWDGPLVIDADALNLLAGRIDELRDGFAKRRCPAVLTPHPAEMQRLLGTGSAADVDRARFEIAADVAARTGAIVLLKGVPTIIAAPDGRIRVSGAGTPALATGGSGDVLTGIIATLLAQRVEPFDAAAAGAWFHGRAAELAGGKRTARGITIDDVVQSLKDVWMPREKPLAEGVLAELPAIG